MFFGVFAIYLFSRRGKLFGVFAVLAYLFSRRVRFSFSWRVRLSVVFRSFNLLVVAAGNAFHCFGSFGLLVFAAGKASCIFLQF